MSPKRDLYGQKSDWRTCFDARSINRFLEPDTYGIPRIKELFRRVSGFKYSSSLDLVGAFHQLPVKEEDRYLTCFTWKGVRYQFCGAPFGLTHIPGHFQRLMQTILQDHHQFVLIYLDDIFIFSSTLDEHISHVRAVITTLTNSNMRIRRGKCHFGYQEAILLGHVISGNGIRADPQKVSTFVNLSRPTSGKQVQAMLGFSSYLRDYIPMYSKIAKPLENLKSPKAITDELWTTVEEKSFQLLKDALSNSPIVSTPNFNFPF